MTEKKKDQAMLKTSELGRRCKKKSKKEHAIKTTSELKRRGKALKDHGLRHDKDEGNR